MKNKLMTAFYFIPAAIGVLFYGFIAINVLPFAVFEMDNVLGTIKICLLLGLLFAAAILMMKGKWWGCIGGIIFGLIFICMGSYDHGQIISESLIGVAYCVYFVICGLLCYMSKKHN